MANVNACQMGGKVSKGVEPSEQKVYVDSNNLKESTRLLVQRLGTTKAHFPLEATEALYNIIMKKKKTCNAKSLYGTSSPDLSSELLAPHSANCIGAGRS